MAKKSYHSGTSKEVREIKETVRDIKRHPVAFAVVVVIIVAVIAIFLLLVFLKPEVFHKFLGVGDHTWSEWTTVQTETCGKNGIKKHTCTVCGEEEKEVIPATGNHDYNGDGEICIVCGYDKYFTGTEEGVQSSELSIHFLELGNKSTGDCILIKCGDTEVLIDAGSEQNSAPTLKSYIDKYCTDGILEYVISTHADKDHISAFVGTKSGSKYNGILYKYQIETFIKFDRSDKNTQIYNNYLDAVEYIETQGTKVYTASQCYEAKNGAQRQYYLDENEKISLNILYNYYYYNSSTDENNYSVVTLLTEELEEGRRNYLFTGDLEEDGESRMVDYYANASNSKSEYDVLPEVDLYKAGHHGSKTSSTAKLLQVIKPKYVAVCCCAGAPEYTTTNVNTFPTQQMIDNISKYTDKIYVTTLGTGFPAKDEYGDYTSRSYEGFTSMNGNIVFYSTDGRLKLWCSNNDTILKETDWFKENRTWNEI